MAVKDALLALLAKEPKHGYELKSQFDAATGESWPLNVGQVYTTLQRLERDGLVATDGQPNFRRRRSNFSTACEQRSQRGRASTSRRVRAVASAPRTHRSPA